MGSTTSGDCFTSHCHYQMETIASTRKNQWPGFKVVSAVLLRVLISIIYLATTFLLAPLFIERLPSPWKTLVAVVWTFCLPFCLVGWLLFIPSDMSPSSPVAVALLFSFFSWVWSVALIRDTFGLNGPVTVVVGIIVVVMFDYWFRGVLEMSGVDRYLIEWPILQVMWKIVEPAVGNLPARFTLRASPPSSAAEEDAPELELGLLGVEVCKIPPPYSYDYLLIP